MVVLSLEEYSKLTDGVEAALDNGCCILPTDNPIILAGKEDAPILSIIERKKKM